MLYSSSRIVDTFKPLWSVLEASRETLESIDTDLIKEIHYRQFWRMRFPRLRVLALQEWHFDVDIPGKPHDFIVFLLAHNNTLEEIDLEYGMYDQYTMPFKSGSEKLTA